MRDLSQLALKKESVPGTAETGFDADDVYFRIRDGDAPDPAADPVETGEMQATSSSRPVGIGATRFQANVSAVIKPSATPMATAPAIALLLEMGMLKGDLLKSIAVGAISGGPYVNGETITGGTSTGTGIVFRDRADGGGTILYVPVTGTLESGEVITGGTSSATSTSSGSPADAGYKYQLVDSDYAGSDSLHHCTVEYLRGGFVWTGRGVLGELAFELRNAQPGILRSTMLGAWDSEADKALYTKSSYADDAVTFPRFNNASLTLGSYTPTDLIDFTLSIPIGLELREDANHAAAAGVRFADYERRNSPPLITFEPAMVLAATHDFFQEFRDGTEFAVTWELGDNIKFYADACQIQSAGAGNRRSLATIPLTLRLNGTNNDELQIHIATAP